MLHLRQVHSEPQMQNEETNKEYYIERVDRHAYWILIINKHGSEHDPIGTIRVLKRQESEKEIEENEIKMWETVIQWLNQSIKKTGNIHTTNIAS